MYSSPRVTNLIVISRAAFVGSVGEDSRGLLFGRFDSIASSAVDGISERQKRGTGDSMLTTLVWLENEGDQILKGSTNS